MLCSLEKRRLLFLPGAVLGLELQQLLFDVESTAVADEVSALADHAMAWNNDRQGIAPASERSR